MKTTIPMDSVLGVLFALGGAAILANAMTMAPLPGMNVGPGLFPSITGAGMALFGLILTYQGWSVRQLVDADEEGQPPLFTWFALGVVAATAGVIVFMPMLGFLICGTLYAIIVVLLSGGRLLAALIFSPIATGVIYAMFTIFMRVSLPQGLLR